MSLFLVVMFVVLMVLAIPVGHGLIMPAQPPCCGKEACR